MGLHYRPSARQKGGNEMKIYYNKESIEVGNVTGDPIPKFETEEREEKQ